MPRPFSETFRIRRSIVQGFEALKAAPLPLLLGAFLMQCTEGGGGSGNWGGGGSGGEGSGDWEELLRQFQLDSLAPSTGGLPELLGDSALAQLGSSDELIVLLTVLAVALLCGLSCGALMFAFRCWIHGGYLLVQEETLRTGQGSFGSLFGGARVFLPLLLWKLLYGLISAGTLFLASMPGIWLALAGVVYESTPLLISGAALALLLGLPAAIYVWLGLFFGDYQVVLDRRGVLESLGASWDMVRGQRLRLLLYLFVMGLFSLTGLVLCCVGVIATRAVRDCGVTEAYLRQTRGEPQLAEMWSLGLQA